MNDLISANKETNTKKLLCWLIPALITLIIAAIPFIIGKYYEFNTDDPFDGALNIFHAHELSIGKKLGVDVFPSAGAATLLVNFIGIKIFGYSEIGPVIIQSIMQITALGFAFVCIRKLFGSIPACISIILGSFYLNCQPYAKFGNVKEQYMIACMILSACAFIYYELYNKKCFLLICGAFAINTWYFKPTGFSLTGALIIYLIITTIIQKRKFNRVAAEISFLAIGSTIGLIPLMLFYLWQKQFASLLADFPAAPVILITIIYLVAVGLRQLIRNANKHTEKINMQLIQRGTIAIVAVLVITTIIFASMGQTKQFLMDIPVIGYPVQVISSAFEAGSSFTDKFYGKIFSDSGYVAGSRIVSTFSKQFAEVARYSHSFVIPIGLGLAAIAWSIFGRFFNKTNVAADSTDDTKPIANQLIIFLASWWLLDMIFIWISPRSYVQYFLPPNGSVMFLAGYILCRSLKNNIGFIFIGAAWLAAEFFTAGQSIVSLSATAIVAAVITVAAGIAFIFIKNKQIATPVLSAVVCLSILLANSSNYQTIGNRLDQVKSAKANNGAFWQHIGNKIKESSNPDDQIYVWGWYPGVYVAAERSCPANRPAYSDMHSDSPQTVKYKINNLVSQLKNDPPLFIVDSQKMHYPANDHPLFDLWPTNPLGTSYFFRNPKTQKPALREFLKNNEINSYNKSYDQQVKSWCLALTKRHVDAKTITQEKAEELADLEVERHKAMEPLRQFIIDNYEPIRLRGLEQMVILKRK